MRLMWDIYETKTILWQIADKNGEKNVAVIGK